MKHKCPILLNPLCTIISLNFWSFYPSEPFTFTRYDMRHPVILKIAVFLNRGSIQQHGVFHRRESYVQKQIFFIQDQVKLFWGLSIPKMHSFIFQISLPTYAKEPRQQEGNTISYSIVFNILRESQSVSQSCCLLYFRVHKISQDLQIFQFHSSKRKID